MEKPKFNIGDEVWCASAETRSVERVCPDCGGTRTLLVTLFDGTQHTMGCAGCERGYLGSTGMVSPWEKYAKVTRGEISEITRDHYEGGYRYRVWHSAYPEGDVFASEGEAKARAVEIQADIDRENEERLRAKEKPNKNWSWHVHYHRRQIREAQRQIEYHTTKLNVAKTKSKEPEECSTSTK